MDLVVSLTAALEWLKAVTHRAGHTDDTGILVRCWDYPLPLLGLPTRLRLRDLLSALTECLLLLP